MVLTIFSLDRMKQSFLFVCIRVLYEKVIDFPNFLGWFTFSPISVVDFRLVFSLFSCIVPVNTIYFKGYFLSCLQNSSGYVYNKLVCS